MALSPLLILLLSVPYESVVKLGLERDLDDVAEAIGGGTTRVELAEILTRNNVWGRLLDASNTDTEPFEFEGPTPTNLVGVFEDTSDRLIEWDQRQPPLSERAESSGEQNQGDAHCVIGDGNQLLVCSRVANVVIDGKPYPMHLISANVRNVRALSFVGVIQLSMEMLIIALLIGFWLIQRVLVPIESLHSQVAAAGSLSPDRTAIHVEDDSEIGALAVEFEQLLRRLEDRNNRTESFASDLAHELKNPLAAISSCSDNLRSGLLESAYVDRYVGVLDRSSEKLQRLVDDFLRLARAESGLKHATRSPTNLITLIEHICDDVGRDYDLEPTFFEFNVEPVDAFVSQTEFRVAVHNIVENAVQIGTDRVVINLTSDGETAELDIRDFGPGFGDVELDDVFERFFSRRDGGTGLGLAIAKAIIVAEQGTIEARRTEDGSLFRIRVPVCERAV